MPCRRICQLEWARPLDHWPKAIPRPRSKKGAKALGLSYEKSLGLILPEAKRGVWFEFRDKNGPGLCQLDYLLASPAEVLVLECKYTWTFDAWDQLEGLYLPILRHLSKKRVLGLQVCKRLQVGSGPVASSLGQARDWARLGRRSCWQWLGNESISAKLEAA